MKNKKFWVSLVAGILAVVMLLSLIISLIPQKASAAKTSSEIKDQINQMKEEQKKTQSEIDELDSKRKENLSSIKDVIAQKSVIEEQIGLLYSQVQLMNEQIAAYNVLIADKQAELDAAEKRLQELTDKNKERIRAMEEDGDISYWSVLFEASSFMDLLDRLNIIQEIAAADSRRLKEMRSAAEEVADAQAVLLSERAELDDAKAELDAMQASLDASNAESQTLLNELASRADEYNALMEDLEGQLDDWVDQIANAQVEYDKVKYQEYLATMTTAPTTAKPTINNNYSGAYGGTSNVDSSGVTWVVPCSYTKVSSAYGWRIHPVYKDYRWHNGVDLSAKCKMHSDGTTDSPIYASRAGVVVVSKYSSSGGWTVTIDHLDGYRSSYLHMCSKPFVSVGDAVGAGQVIGCIGSTGVSTGDHLHFTIYKYDTEKNKYVDVNPMDYIG